MRYYAMKRRLKLAGAILIILLFLPYILSVFINGKRFQERGLQDENEIYVMEKLMQDMPESYETEALRAQVVLIRTSLYRELEASESKTVAEDQELQKELQQNQNGIKSKDSYEKYKEAVSETQNQVLFYNESLAWTPFHRSSDGMTRVAAEVLGTDEFPYIISKECPLDKAAEDEIQVHTFEYSQIQKLCRDFLEAAEDQESAEKGYSFDDFEIQSVDTAGYVQELRVGNTICTGDQFRDALSLPSSAFSFYESTKGLKITTTGNGHGLGMSQWTANEMAKEGSTYEEILAYFFEGTELRSISDGF